MRGFEVWLSDGERRELEATHYEVGESGELTVWGGSDPVANFAASSWVEIRRMGTLLSKEWPYPRMSYLTENLAEFLIGRYGGWLYGLDEERTSDWRLNDLDELIAAILEGASLDPKAVEDRSRVREVRRLVAAEFDLRLDPR